MRALATIVIGLSLGLMGACSSSTDSGTTTSAGSTSGGAGTAPIGEGCKSTADCESGLSCSTDDPGGQCVKGCKVQSDCPSGSTCTDEGTCYLSCTKQSDCTRAGYECNDASTVDGKPTRTCDVAPDKASGAIGDSCAANADCKSATCSTDDPDGQCVAGCKAQRRTAPPAAPAPTRAPATNPVRPRPIAPAEGYHVCRLHDDRPQDGLEDV